MGFSLKKIGNLAGKAIGASAGAYFGGPAGAAAGYNGADAVLGVVGLGDDQLAAQENWNLQKKAADYKYQQDLNMWNLINAYNDPSAQAERLERAGLNKNLLYGGGNVTGNTSGSGPEYASLNVGYTDRSIQRKQLAMALEDHQQRITNQAIENDLARQRLVLAERDADRSDALAQAQIGALKAGLGLTGARIDEINSNRGFNLQKHYDDDYNLRLKQWKLAEERHLKDLSFKQAVRHKMGLKNYDDPWYRNNPQPLRDVVPSGHVRSYGRRR